MHENSVFPLWRAPHRLAFLLGMFFSLILFAIWLAELFSRLGPHMLPSQIHAVMAHAFLMMYGIFPLFMTGFLLTAGPRWLGVSPPGRAGYLTISALLGAGLLVWLQGLWLGRHWALAGHLLYSLGFAGLCFCFAQMMMQSRQPDRQHAWIVLCSLVLGLFGLLAGGDWLWSGNGSAWFAMCNLALWGFLLPVFLTVSHRMLPFFTNAALPHIQAWRPYRLLYLMLAGVYLHGLLLQLGFNAWLPDVLLALLFIHTSRRWGLLAARSNRLLFMLHLSFAWTGLGFALYALSQICPALHAGQAPLHAITVGFFMTMAVGFVTRVSLGHSGRPLVASPLLWGIYLAAQIMAVLRVLADFLPATWSGYLYVAAAGWGLLVLAIWGLRFIGTYLRSRVDGKPG